MVEYRPHSLFMADLVAFDPISGGSTRRRCFLARPAIKVEVLLWNHPGWPHVSCPIEDLDQFGRDQFPPCSHQGRSFGRGLCGDQGIGQLLFGWRGALNLVRSSEFWAAEAGANPIRSAAAHRKKQILDLDNGSLPLHFSDAARPGPPAAYRANRTWD